MERDDNVVVFGEDVGYFGGVFRCTEGLQAKYGSERVFDTPIAEGGIIGAAVGMGAYGLRPVVEIQFADYVYPGLDQLISEAARLRYRSSAEFTAPMTVRMPCGGGIHGGQTHSQSPESLFTHVCGLKTVMPSNPYDAKGLLIAAIEDDDPVIFLEPKRIYNGPFDGHHDQPVVPWSSHPLGEVPDGYYRVDLGSAADPPTGRRPHRAGLRHDGATSPRRPPRRPASTPRSSTCARCCRSTPTRSRRRCARPDGASSSTRRRAPAGSAPSCRPPCRSCCFYRLEAPIERVTGWDTPVSARPGVGLLPGAGPRRRRLPSSDGGLTMSEYVVKLPDVGEGIAEAEIVEWHVNVGDTITEDQVMVEVMTDKATVELPSPVAGSGHFGRRRGRRRPAGRLAADSDRDRQRSDRAKSAPAPARRSPTAPDAVEPTANRLRGRRRSPPVDRSARRSPLERSARAAATAAPAVRQRASHLGIDLAESPARVPMVESSTPISTPCSAARAGTAIRQRSASRVIDDDVVDAVPVIGLRRNIAQRMQVAKARIPHFTYVEEVDVTEVERLRAELNRQHE